ncbi:polysaccharide lyase family 8 super-sandwich domain-containing protein [Sinomicrobium sp.]
MNNRYKVLSVNATIVFGLFSCHLLAGVSLVAVDTMIQAQNRADFKTVYNRYVQFLYRLKKEDPLVGQYAASLDENGQWSDIDYTDQKLADWKPTWHLQRVEKMAYAWKNPNSDNFGKDDLWQAIIKGLRHWLDHKYKSDNWWFNRIGVPRIMRDILFLLNDDLSSEDRKEALEVLYQFRGQSDTRGPVGLGKGANLIWIADLGLHYGILTENKELVKEYRDHIVEEIKVSTGEGIQPDYSYHQHHSRLQIYHYGEAFLRQTVRLAWELRETSFAFPEEKVNILEDFVFEGWQWMARGINTVPGTIDRASSRVGELRSPDIRKLIPLLKELSPQRAEEYTTLLQYQEGRSHLTGFRYYPYSDFTVYHNDDFSFFLKTISRRTLSTEQINGENLKGQLLNSGDAYIVRNGKEYYNMMPVWDWKFLPGVTAFRGAERIDRKDFVGSVGSWESGLTAMDYKLEDSSGYASLSARKIWAVHNNMVVCLISGLNPVNVKGEVYTAIDQSSLQGEVRVSEIDKALGKGEHILEGVDWIYHSGIAYIPLSSACVNIKIGAVSGRWSEINTSRPDQLLTEDIYLPVMKHNTANSDSTGYIITTSKTVQEVQQLVDNPQWKILQNNRDCQAVLFDDKTVMSAFFSPGTLKIGSKQLETDRPCLVLLDKEKVYVSDPTHRGGVINIKWNGVKTRIEVPEDGFTVCHKFK